jgi:PD-(D/E)XK nuclease superfamily
MPRGSTDIAAGLTTVLDSLISQMPLLDAHRAGAEMYAAPRLSSFDLFGPNEFALSRIVASLFDPLGSHGQGTLFLNELLADLNLPRVAIRDIVNVNREVLTDKGRRINIVIETPHVLLGVENKPWAGQQRDQLIDYYKELQRRARQKSFRLVFLSDQSEQTAQGEVVRMPYQQLPEGRSLYRILSSALDSIKAPCTRTFVEEFMQYIDIQFGEGEMIKESKFAVYPGSASRIRCGTGEEKGHCCHSAVSLKTSRVDSE